MKRICLILLCALIPLTIYSASINNDLIDVRDDLFDSEKELEEFQFKTTLTKAEEQYYDEVDIYLLTGGPGSLVWENFGHSAFVVKLPDRPYIAFDYGIFSFGKGFYKNFALGRLYYSVMVSYAEYRDLSLKSDDRSVSYLPLTLSALEKCNLLEFLEYNTQDENSTYLYNYYLDNCATRLRDSYSAVTNGDFEAWAKAQDAKESLRSYSKRYLSRSSLPITWAINYLLGPIVDKPISRWEAMFLPDELDAALEDYQGNEAYVEYESETRKETPKTYTFFLYSILFALILTLPILLTKTSRRWIRIIGDLLSALIYIVLAVMALVLLFLMCASIHDVTYLNENVLILSPLLLVLGIMHIAAIGKKEKRKGLRILSKILLIFTFLIFFLKISFMSVLIQENLEYYILALLLYSAELLPEHIRRK